MKIDSTKYGTPTEVADAIGVARTTLITAVSRDEIKHARTIGGSMLIDVESAKAWAGVARRTGPKSKSTE